MPDSLRLCLGTFTVLRVPPPRRVDTRTARGALLLSPAVGAVLALVAGLVLVGWRWAAPPAPPGTAPLVNLLASTLAVAVLALLTRGLHLDGLADTADGLGSGRTGDDALAVMRRSDIGPFGVLTLVLVLGVEVSALAVSTNRGHGTVALVVAVVTGRTACVWACRRGVPAARPDGLGAAVASTVPAVAAATVTAAVLLVSLAFVRWDDDRTWREVVAAPVAVVAGLLVAGWLVRRAVRRFGGVTGDVLGAAVETATVTALVVLALA